VRLIIARCQVDYAGRLSAHLPEAVRLVMVKADGSVLVHSDAGGYKPLMWMTPPCAVREVAGDDGVVEWRVGAAKSDDTLRIQLFQVLSDTAHELGTDPGLRKDGVEKHLQELLAEHPATLGAGLSLVRREYPTAIGPVDLMCRDAGGAAVTVAMNRRGDIDVATPAGPRSRRHVAVEVKRRAGIDAVEQLTRYLDLLNRDPLLAPVRGVLAAQSIAPQARVLADDRGIEVVVVDYDVLRGLDDPSDRLF
jgi:RecB family endonuclease NucS